VAISVVYKNFSTIFAWFDHFFALTGAWKFSVVTLDYKRSIFISISTMRQLFEVFIIWATKTLK